MTPDDLAIDLSEKINERLELLEAIECHLPHLSIFIGFRDRDGVGG